MMVFYFIRSIIFYLLFATITVAVSIIFSPFLIVRCKALYWAGIIWCRISLFLLKIICGVDYKVVGKENLPKDPYIVASKHQSAFETIAFWDVFYIPTFVLKKELTRIPFFGIFLVRMRMIAISRSAGASALKQIVKESEYHLKEGRHIIIYPEGTRVNYGERVEKYHPGIIALYNNCNVPIVPVALNSGKFWDSRKWIKYPGTITIKILPAIQLGLSKQEFIDSLQKAIETNSAEL